MSGGMFNIPGAQKAPCDVCETQTCWRIHGPNDGFVPICSTTCAVHWPKLHDLREYVGRLEKYIERGDFDVAQTAVRLRHDNEDRPAKATDR